MTQTSYTDLCHRIREKCQQQNWFTGDLDNTARFREPYRYEILYTANGKEIIKDYNPDGHPCKIGFAYAVATEKQLLATEKALGFPLPPLLRVLYARIANGGFGPGHGIAGAISDFCDTGDLVDNYLYYTSPTQLIELEDYEQLIEPGESVELPDTVWPHYLLYLCDWEWATASCMDCSTGQVFLVHPGERAGYYRLELQAHSLVDWLELWLRGGLKYDGAKEWLKRLAERDDKPDPVQLLPEYEVWSDPPSDV
jgi:hypothetical protein